MVRRNPCQASRFGNRGVMTPSRQPVGSVIKPNPTIPETFLGIGYTRGRAGLPLEAGRVSAPRPGADQVLIRVAASSLNPLEYKLADLNFMGRTPPVVLGLDLSGIGVATGHDVRGVAVGDAVAAMA